MLFDKTNIKGMELKNRVFRAATMEGLAGENGECTPELIDIMVNYAKGGTGLIFPGHTYVEKQGKAGRRQLGIYDDSLIPGLKKMADEVHSNGGKIGIQLAHSGIFAIPKITGSNPVAPSLLKGITKHDVMELSISDINKIISKFAAAALRVKNAGFDCLEIHAAHGYLLSQFLSPFFNKRTDDYGGSVENRARILLEIIKSIKEKVEELPVFVKLNSSDYLEDGLDFCDSIAIGKLLKLEGADVIELSGGTLISHGKGPTRTAVLTEEDEVYFRDAATDFKREVNLPLILVGGIRSFHIAEELLNNNTADYISLSRPLIREPELVNRWKSGDFSKAECISCSKCFGPVIRGRGLYCVVDKK